MAGSKVDQQTSSNNNLALRCLIIAACVILSMFKVGHAFEITADLLLTETCRAVCISVRNESAYK